MQVLRGWRKRRPHRVGAVLKTTKTVKNCKKTVLKKRVQVLRGLRPHLVGAVHFAPQAAAQLRDEDGQRQVAEGRTSTRFNGLGCSKSGQQRPGS